MLAVILLIIVACTKEPDPSPSGGGGNNSGSAPSAPTGVSATVSGSQIYVSWNRVSNANYYEIYYSETSNGSYEYIDDIWETETYISYSNGSLPDGDYYFKIKAVNDYGSSPYSSYAYCHYSSGGGGGGGNGGGGNGGGSGSAPVAPTGVSAEVSGSQIRVSWNSVSDATRYIVYYSSTGGNYSYLGSTSSTYYYDSNPREDNYYKVKAENSYGESSYSSYAYCHYSSGGGGGGGGGGGSINYPPCPPTVSVSGTASSISVSWTKATGTTCGTPTSYKVYKRNPYTAEYDLKTTTTSTSYRDTDVHPGYNRYAVEAINNYGSDLGLGYSSEITLSKPSSFTAQKYQNTYIRCTWSKVSQATGYQISLSTTASGTYVWEQIDEVNTTTKDIYYPASSGTTVYLRVRAYYDAPYIGSTVYSDYTTYKSVTF